MPTVPKKKSKPLKTVTQKYYYSCYFSYYLNIKFVVHKKHVSASVENRRKLPFLLILPAVQVARRMAREMRCQKVTKWNLQWLYTARRIRMYCEKNQNYFLKACTSAKLNLLSYNAFIYYASQQQLYNKKMLVMTQSMYAKRGHEMIFTKVRKTSQVIGMPSLVTTPQKLS